MLARRIGLLLVFALLAPTFAAERQRIAVIVHPERQADVSIEDVAQIFLRRKRFWDDGTPVVPLNLPSETKLRDRFTELVLHQSGAHLAEYWNRQYFRGILPPPTLASTESVRRYVASDRNAIGYVPDSEVDSTVRVVLRLE